jgi:hypothetical protein
MRGLSVAIWIAVAVELIERLQVGRLASTITEAGMLCWISALMVGPQCWGFIDARPGSSARKTLTLLVFFGFMLQISGLIARFAR